MDKKTIKNLSFDNSSNMDIKLNDEQIQKIHDISQNFLDEVVYKSSENFNLPSELKKFLNNNNLSDSFIESKIDQLNLEQNLIFNEKEVQEVQNDIKNFAYTENSENAENKLSLKDISNEFIKAGKDAAIVGAVAAAAAAGFWAASFWTSGATIPWATACTIASAGAFAEGAIMGITGELIKNSYLKYLSYSIREAKKIWDIKSYYDFINNIKKVKAAAKVLRGISLSTSWAAPIVAIMSFSLGFIIDKVEY